MPGKKKIQKKPPKKEIEATVLSSKKGENALERSSKLHLLLRPHIIFVILAFVFGTGILITTPPFQVADEIAHFDRAYKLSEFSTFQKTENNVSGDYVPSNIDSAFMMFRYLSWRPTVKVEKEKIYEAFNIPLEKNNKKFVGIDAGPYFYLSYIPQYPAIYLGKIFNLNVLAILYIGRFFGLLFYILCVWYAIKIIPTAKYLLMTVALMPMCLAQAGSYNADCVLFSFSFLAIALLLKITFEKKKFSFNRKSVLLFLILVSLGILKPVYMPIAFSALILPKIIFKNNWRYFAITFSVIAMACLLTFLWLKSNSLYLDYSDPNTDAQEKMKYLFNHPFFPIKIANETFGYFKDMHYYQTIGVLGYLDTKLPGWVYASFTIVIGILTLFESDKKHRLFIYQRVIFLFIAVMVFFMIISTLFLTNHRGNGLIVFGIQGRYFIPIIFPLLLAFHGLIPFRLNLSRRTIPALLLVLILIIALTGTQLALIDRYYNS